MRKLLAVLFLFCGAIVYGQVVPQGINYQAVALDQQGQPIPGVDIVGRPIDDAEIGVRISILEASPTGNVLYQEEHEVLTDQYGMFNLTIGQGLQVSADAFNTINWQGDKFLQVELSIENDGKFTLSAVQQLMSVPYAFLADRALNVDDADADPTNEIQSLSVSGDSLSLSNGNTVQLPAINDADADSTNELQAISMSNDTLYLSSGGFVVLPADQINDADADPTNEFQTITRNGSTINLSGNGGSVTVFDGDYTNLTNTPTIPSKTSDLVNDSGFITSEQDADSTNELQTLSLSGDSLTISAGNTVLLPTSDDLDKDPKNELQQLYVQNDSLFLTADTSGVGYAINQNGRSLIDIEFDKNCFPVPYKDSIQMQTSGGVKPVFIQEFQKTVLVSAYSDVTLVLDSNGNRLAKHNIGFTYGDNWNATPIFNNNVVYRDGAYFAGLRINNNGSDTVGTTIISDSSYILVLNANGAYQNHFSLDSMYANGNTSIRISAISGADIYLQCNKSDAVKCFKLNANTGSFVYTPIYNQQVPLFTQNNEYWVGTSAGSDSCLAFSTITNGTKAIQYYSDTSYYSSTWFVSYILPNDNNLRRKSYPKRNFSCFFEAPGEDIWTTRLGGWGRSYIDTNFRFIDMPLLMTGYSGGTAQYLLDGCLSYFVNDTLIEIRDGSVNPNNLYYRPYLVFGTGELKLNNEWRSRLQYSYDINTSGFSQMLVEPTTIGNGLITGLNLASSSNWSPSFQPFGNFVITPYGARGNCADSFYGGQYLIMHKDDFESVVIH